MRIDLWKGLKASALVYTVLISLILSLITLSLITAMQLHNQRIAEITDMHQVVRNADSGVTLMLADPQLGRSGTVGADLFGDGADSVYLKRIPWGGYEVISVQAKRRRQTANKHVLVGAVMSDTMNTLTMADQGKPLSLCGDTRIEGPCLVPKSGVKRAYIEGKNYVGRKLIYGSQSKSPASLPSVSIPAFNELISEDAEVMDHEDLQVLTLEKSFADKQLLIESVDRVDLSRMSCSGNVLIRSETGIHVGSSTELSGCILSAPKVSFDRGFEGDVQVYADSVTIGLEVKLKYPSGIYSKDGAVSLDEGAILAGYIVMERSNAEPVVSLADDVKVYGTLYNQGMTELKAAVYGQLLTGGFILRTASATYENHLLDAVISQSELPRPFATHVTGDAGLITIKELK